MHPRALIALLKGAHAVHAQRERLAYIRLLRDCLNGVDRKVGLDVLVAAVPAIIEIGGDAAIKECAHAVTDPYRWWP